MKPTSVAVAVVLFLTMFAVPINGAVAQEDELPKLNFANQFGPSSGFGGLGNSASEITFSGEFKVKPDSRTGVLSITADIAEGWHTYSVTQQKGGPTPSMLKLVSPETVKLTGEFKPDRNPTILPPDIFPVPSEEHEGKLVWSAPIELADGVNSQDIKIKVEYDGQVCENGVDGMPGVCKYITDEIVEAGYAGVLAAANPTATEYRAARSHAKLTGRIEPNVVAPGDTFALVLTASMDQDWHVYELVTAEKNPDRISKPTIIALTKSNNWPASQPVASGKPIAHKTGLEAEPVQYFHEGQVSWTITITVPQDAPPGAYDLAGAIGYQTCTLETCDLPLAAAFSGSITVGEKKSNESSALGFEKYVSYRKVESDIDAMKSGTGSAVTPTATAEPTLLDLQSLNVGGGATGSDLSLGVVMLMAFGAGFILNFMPCVLPVIGLKVMSFVQQAGQSRGRILTLNLVYVAGLMSVFLILAALAVFVGVGWGAQFQRPWFNVALASVVFAFSLSFLGVWEIPIPGFANSSSMNKAAEGEGLAGAFFKGVLTTVLATPCAGPMLVPALAWAVAQPPLIAFTAYALVGLGMAFPFIIIGFFPSVVSFLPKPGAWMDTFKHIMGFVLLGTVVFILTFMSPDYVIPTVAVMMGIWAALWWVGRVPLYEPLSKQLTAWVQGLVFAILIGLYSFGNTYLPASLNSWSLLSVMHGRLEDRIKYEASKRGGGGAEPIVDMNTNVLPWQPYSLPLLERLVGENKTVFIDFTAPS